MKTIIELIKTSESRSTLIITWLPALVLFIMVPFTIYVNNQMEYDYAISIMLPFVILLLLFMGASLCIFFLSSRWQNRISRLFFLLGVYLLFTDIFTPINWGLMDGESQIIESSMQAVFQGFIIVILIFIFIKVSNENIKKYGSTLVLILFLMQPFFFGIKLSKNTVWKKEKETHVIQNKDTKITGNNHVNIYHIVFDGYSSLKFLDSLEETDLKKEFNAFTFYKNNLSNYIVTDASVPSYLTGSLYKDNSFNDWQLSSKKNGLIHHLSETGYTIWMYSPDQSRFWTHDKATHLKTNKDLIEKYFYGTDTLSIAQICFVRLSPSLLRNEALIFSDKVIIKFIRALNIIFRTTDVKFPGLKSIEKYSYYKRLSVPLFRDMIKDEKRRGAIGNYTYGHFMIPHPPFVWDRNGKFDRDSNYYEQALCANQLMVELIHELKKLNRFDKTLIILQSDHGYHNVLVKNENVVDFNKTIQKKIDSSHIYFSSNGISQRLYSLLLLKPPHAKESSLVVSDKQTQLIDIPATVYDILDKDIYETDGDSVLKITENENRTIHVYLGIYKRDQDNKIKVLGNHFFKTDLIHLSFQNESGWRLYPDLTVNF